MFELVAHSKTFTDVFVRIAGPLCGEIPDRKRDLAANAKSLRCRSPRIGKQELVRKGGGAATGHLCNRQFHAVGGELCTDVRFFGGPDMILQPGHQW